jgi:hypothetical protein
MREASAAAVLAACAVFAVAGGRPALQAQTGDPAAIERRADGFARSLAQAMARRDRSAVASMIRHPATVVAGGLTIPLIDRATTLQLYNLVFTPELRCLLEQSGMRRAGQPAPRYPIRADAAGAMLADGRVRVEQIDGDLRVIRIIVPPASGIAPPPPSKPQRVAFRGQNQAQYAGRLYGDGVDSYLVKAGRGSLLEARIERFPGRNAAVRVTHQPSGRVLDRPGAPAPRTWVGRLTEAGEYRIDVVRQAPFCEPPFTYLLTVTLR